MGKNADRRPQKTSQRSPGQMVYLEADLSSGGDTCFYTGFSNGVRGIFLATYNIECAGKPIAVRLRFPDGKRGSVSGTVEWTREYNPLVPEMAPGMGIRIQNLSSAVSKRIDDYIQTHATLFYDDEEPLRKPVGEQERRAAEETDPTEGIGTADTCVFSEDEKAFQGLLEDVRSYLERQAELRGRGSRAGTVAASDTVRAKILLADDLSRQFQGGFTREDNEYRVFVSTGKSRAIGSKVELLVELPDGWHLRAGGTVRWARRPNPMLSSLTAPPGLGLCLDTVWPSAWQAAINHMPKRRGCLMCEELKE